MDLKSESESQHDYGKEILVIKVEITHNQQDEIVVHENDEPADLAQNFCSKHRLEPRMLIALADTIEQHIEQLVEEEINNKPYTELNTTQELYNQYLEIINKRDHLIHDISKKREFEFDKNLRLKPQMSKDIMNYPLLEKAKKVHKGMLKEYKNKKDNYSYKPNIYPKYSIYSSQQILRERTQNEMDSFNRLYQEAQNRLIDIQKKSEFIQQEQCPFKPDIKKHNLYKRSSSSSEINSNKSLKQSSISNIRSRKKPSNQNEQKKQILTAKVTPRILSSKSKEDRFTAIFNLLGPDSCNLLQYDSLNMKSLPPIIIQIIKPLLDQMIRNKASLMYEEFIIDMDNLFNQLTIPNRTMLLAQHKWTVDYKANLANHLRDEKIKEKQKQKIEQEMEQCTFKPRINPYLRY